jgi:hypothetical protein
MRRVTASLMLVMFSFPLLATTLFADAFSGLPACCRRGGTHHCEMTAMESSGQGPDMLPGRCSSSPESTAARLNPQAPFSAQLPSSAEPVSFAPAVPGGQHTPHAQFQGRARKRGPPIRFE